MHHGLQCLHTRFQCLNIGLRFGRELFPHVVGYGTRCFHGDRVCYAETGSQALSFHYLNGYSVETPQGVPPQHVVMIQGKPFVKFAGLLQMAHERGLVSLTADWTYNDAELSLAHAVATFQDGRRFEESGDASPGNVTRMVAVHFRRVALTRAKARVLTRCSSFFALTDLARHEPKQNQRIV